MKQEDWTKFCELIQGADETITGKFRTEKALSLMFTGLMKYELADIAAAILDYVGTQKLPVPINPAEIISRIQGDKTERSALAWRHFLQAVDRYGVYDSVRFPDPAFHFAIDQLGGWERVSEEYIDLTDKERQFREKNFRQLYEIGLREATWDNVQRYLPGRYERENVAGGHDQFIPPVIDTKGNRELDRLALTAGTGAKLKRLDGGGGA